MLTRILVATLALLVACVLYAKASDGVCVNGVCAAGTQPVSAPAPLPAGPHAPAVVVAPAPSYVRGGHLHPVAALAHAIRSHMGLIRCQMQHAREAIKLRAHAPVRTFIVTRPHPVRNGVRGRRCR